MIDSRVLFVVDSAVVDGEQWHSVIMSNEIYTEFEHMFSFTSSIKTKIIVDLPEKTLAWLILNGCTVQYA